MTDPTYTRAVEAVLFAAAEPLREQDILAHAGEGDLAAALPAAGLAGTPGMLRPADRAGRGAYSHAGGRR